MAAKSQRLTRVQDLKKRQEDTAAQTLSGAEQTLAAQQAKLQQIQGFKHEYSERFVENCAQGINSALLQNYRAFLAQLDTAVDQQRLQVTTAERQCSQSRQGWIAKRRDTKAIEKLVGRARVGEAQAQDKQEQFQMDEHAARIAAKAIA